MIKDWKITHIAYRGLNYFETGKGLTARFYQWIPELIIILGGMKYLLGIEFSKPMLLFIGLMATLWFIGFGRFLIKSGIYGVDRYTQTRNDPVWSEILEAARVINAKNRKVKK